MHKGEGQEVFLTCQICVVWRGQGRHSGIGDWDSTQGCHAISSWRGSGKEKVIEDVNNPWDIQLIFIHSMAEENWSKMKGALQRLKGEDHNEEIQPFPFHPEKFSIRGMARDVTKG